MHWCSAHWQWLSGLFTFLNNLYKLNFSGSDPSEVRKTRKNSNDKNDHCSPNTILNSCAFKESIVQLVLKSCTASGWLFRLNQYLWILMRKIPITAIRSPKTETVVWMLILTVSLTRLKIYLYNIAVYIARKQYFWVLLGKIYSHNCYSQSNDRQLSEYCSWLSHEQDWRCVQGRWLLQRIPSSGGTHGSQYSDKPWIVWFLDPT